MAELIQMRRRIKVIETIKKITHAMRLIAMSTHSQLKNKQATLIEYKTEIESLFAKISSDLPTWKNPILHPDTQTKKTLIIIIGSQKGLCGSFNHYLFKLINKSTPSWQKPYDILSIGSKANSYAKQFEPDKHIRIKEYSIRSIQEVTARVVEQIVQIPTYRKVIIYSNLFQSFFKQKPNEAFLVPFRSASNTITPPAEDYLWPEAPQTILDDLVPQYIESSIYYYLFESLFAEQAARFLSMDNATRNAQGLLDSTQLAYNKLRQAKITKELIELTGSLT